MCMPRRARCAFAITHFGVHVVNVHEIAIAELDSLPPHPALGLLHHSPEHGLPGGPAHERRGLEHWGCEAPQARLAPGAPLHDGGDDEAMDEPLGFGPIWRAR